MRTLLAACGLAILWASPSAAVPLTGNAPQTETITTTVATFVCTRDERGWHYMRGDRRVTCRPARPEGRFWGWHCEGPRCGWWHRKAPLVRLSRLSLPGRASTSGPHQHQLSGISSIRTLNHKAYLRWMQPWQSMDAPLRATARSLMTRWPFSPQADTAKKQSLMRA